MTTFFKIKPYLFLLQKSSENVAKHFLKTHLLTSIKKTGFYLPNKVIEPVNISSSPLSNVTAM